MRFAENNRISHRQLYRQMILALLAPFTGYKDPYHTSVITKAKRKDINIDVPSYGKGYYKNAYQNIVTP